MTATSFRQLVDRIDVYSRTLMRDAPPEDPPVDTATHGAAIYGLMLSDELYATRWSTTNAQGALVPGQRPNPPPNPGPLPGTCSNATIELNNRAERRLQAYNQACATVEGYLDACLLDTDKEQVAHHAQSTNYGLLTLWQKRASMYALFGEFQISDIMAARAIMARPFPADGTSFLAASAAMATAIRILHLARDPPAKSEELRCLEAACAAIPCARDAIIAYKVANPTIGQQSFAGMRDAIASRIRALNNGAPTAQQAGFSAAAAVGGGENLTSPAPPFPSHSIPTTPAEVFAMIQAMLMNTGSVNAAAHSTPSAGMGPRRGGRGRGGRGGGDQRSGGGGSTRRAVTATWTEGAPFCAFHWPLSTHTGMECHVMANKPHLFTEAQRKRTRPTREELQQLRDQQQQSLANN